MSSTILELPEKPFANLFEMKMKINSKIEHSDLFIIRLEFKFYSNPKLKIIDPF